MDLPENLLSVVYHLRMHNFADPYETAVYKAWRDSVTDECIQIWGCQLWFGRIHHTDPVWGKANSAYGMSIYELFCDRFNFGFPENPTDLSDGFKLWKDYYEVKFGWGNPPDSLLTRYYKVLQSPYSENKNFQFCLGLVWKDYNALLSDTLANFNITVRMEGNELYFQLHNIAIDDDDAIESDPEEDPEEDPVENLVEEPEEEPEEDPEEDPDEDNPDSPVYSPASEGAYSIVTYAGFEDEDMGV